VQHFKLKYIPNKHQREFQSDITSRFLHLSTGFGGGKTYSLAQKLIQLSVLNKNMAGGLVVVDYSEFKKDILPEFQFILDANNIPYRFHQTEKWFLFPWSSGKLYVVTAEKPIRGQNWAYCGLNEVTLMPLVRYKEAIGRVRIKSAPCPMIVSSGTPEGHISEYYEYMIENPPRGFRIIYGSTDDNLHNLGDFYIDNLEASYDTKMLEAYRQGLWVNMSESLFYYSYDPTKNHDDTLQLNDYQSFHISMDFNVDPFCATIWGYDGYGLYGLDQIELKGKQGYSTVNMVDAMQARGFTPNNSIIYPDPAGKARSTKGLPDITVLRNAGYETRFRPAAPDFRKRQLNVNNLLDKGIIKFNSIKCTGIRKDFVGVEQDKITLEKLKDNPNLTHYSDGLDYMCDILYPFSGNAKGTLQTVIR